MVSEAIPCCWQAIGLDEGVMAQSDPQGPVITQRSIFLPDQSSGGSQPGGLGYAWEAILFRN